MMKTSISPQLVFLEPPPNYNPRVDVAACFIFVRDRVLFLKRVPHKSEANKWGIPGGKVEKGELPIDAAVREMLEETHIDISKLPIQHKGSVFIRYPEVDFNYHMYAVHLKEIAEVIIDPADHTEYEWLTLKEALQLPLIRGEDECIYLAYGDSL